MYLYEIPSLSITKFNIQYIPTHRKAIVVILTTANLHFVQSFLQTDSLKVKIAKERKS